MQWEKKQKTHTKPKQQKTTTPLNVPRHITAVIETIQHFYSSIIALMVTAGHELENREAIWTQSWLFLLVIAIGGYLLQQRMGRQKEKSIQF